MRCYGAGLFQIKEVVKLFDRLGSSTGMAMGQIENEDAMLQALVPALDALIEQCHVSEEDLVDDDADDEGVKPPKPKRAMTLACSGEQLHQEMLRIATAYAANPRMFDSAQTIEFNYLENLKNYGVEELAERAASLLSKESWVRVCDSFLHFEIGRAIHCIKTKKTLSGCLTCEQFEAVVKSKGISGVNAMCHLNFYYYCSVNPTALLVRESGGFTSVARCQRHNIVSSA